MHAIVHLTPIWMKQQTLSNVQHAQMEVQQIQLEDLHHVVSVQLGSFNNFQYLKFFLISMLIYVTLTALEHSCSDLGILTTPNVAFCSTVQTYSLFLL